MSWLDALYVTGATSTASYVTLDVSGDLTAERVLTAGTGIVLTDGGAGAAVTLSLGVSGVAAAAYTLPFSATIDTYGRVTSATQGTNIALLTGGDRAIGIGDGASIGYALTVHGGDATLGAGGAATYRSGAGSAGEVDGVVQICSGDTPVFGAQVNGSGAFAIGFASIADSPITPPVITSSSITTENLALALIALGLMTETP